MENFTSETIKQQHTLKIFIITLSDRASKGIYEDLSGKLIREIVEKDLTEKGWQFETQYFVIPDETDEFRHKLLKAKAEQADLIFTTGSTGVGPRDIAPEVVKPLLDKEIPGIMELIRVKYGMNIPNAVLSRGVAGFIGSAQIYTLPGSVKAVKDYMAEIIKTMEHLIFMYRGIDSHGAPSL
jgi:molybdenum cofactor synthesis domain-containing protein